MVLARPGLTLPFISAPPRLRGRDDELAAIRAQLLELGRGTGSVTVVEGPPGSGKTRLLAEAVATARAFGVVAAAGGAARGGRVVPMGALLDALIGGAKPLLDSAAVRDVYASEETRYWLIQETEALLERATLEQPVLVVVDDLQWADGGSVAAIEALATRLAAMPIAWLVAVRTTEVPGDLRAVLDRLQAAGGVRIWLNPLRELPAEEPLLPCFPVDVTDQPALVRIALAAGERELAASVAALAAERAERNPNVATVTAAALHAHGLLGGEVASLRGALEHYERSPRRPAVAAALEDLAALAPREEAVDLLGRALELCADMGAAWDASRLRRRLRDLGVRRRLTASEEPPHGWAALTRSELAVVDAITGGMTNREAAAHLFLSPHTVSTHLRHIFEKLNITSRVELARIAAEHDAAPASRG